MLAGRAIGRVQRNDLCDLFAALAALSQALLATRVIRCWRSGCLMATSRAGATRASEPVELVREQMCRLRRLSGTARVET
jgi:hypothetical protein